MPGVVVGGESFATWLTRGDTVGTRFVSMPYSQRVSRRLFATAVHFFADAICVVFGFGVGAALRFGEWVPEKMWWYAPGILVAALVLPSVIYIGGLYSSPNAKVTKWRRMRWLILALALCLVIVLAVGSINYSGRIGRLVLLVGYPITCTLCILHHAFLHRWMRYGRESAICVVSGNDDELAASILGRHCRSTRVIGVVSIGGYVYCGEAPLLGTLDSSNVAADWPRPDLVLVRDRHLVMPSLAALLRQWRYEGIEIVSLADLCEEVFHAVPLDLVSENWLFRASSQSGLFYVKKLKRLFDIAAALFFMVVLSPLLLLGMLLVKLGSPGPVFFRQVRLGRLGRPFEVVKLRTMPVDAEKEGPQWSGSNDPRVFGAGKWLRKFRFDEIPQLLNVLRGEMSFVGPRPERPEFVKELEKQIPNYRERLLIQPGLTGWAQVQYPYGSTVQDAWRKLEFDLYYMKHMSVLLDFFILLETVRTVLGGGVRKAEEGARAAMREWQEMERTLRPESGGITLEGARG